MDSILNSLALLPSANRWEFSALIPAYLSLPFTHFTTHNAHMEKLLFLIFLVLPEIAIASSAAQDHAQLENLVAAFVQQQTAALPGKVSYKIDAIDSRITLPACANLEVFLPDGSQLIGKTSVGVRCNVANGWSIFIAAQIKVSLNLLTSARQLSPGHVLQEKDLTTQLTETTRTMGYSDPNEIVGKVLRFGITAGQILRDDMLRLPYSVTQGNAVQIDVQGEGFSIRSDGVALNNASEGQTVQVRVSSGRPISGIARAEGIVEVGQ